MSCYVNPIAESKEEFLKREGRKISAKEAQITEKEYPVCLINNGMFTAAGIGYSPNEIAAFSDPKDMRPKQWFMIPTEKLFAVSPLQMYLEG